MAFDTVRDPVTRNGIFGFKGKGSRMSSDQSPELSFPSFRREENEPTFSEEREIVCKLSCLTCETKASLFRRFLRTLANFS